MFSAEDTAGVILNYTVFAWFLDFATSVRDFVSSWGVLDQKVEAALDKTPNKLPQQPGS